MAKWWPFGQKSERTIVVAVPSPLPMGRVRECFGELEELGGGLFMVKEEDRTVRVADAAVVFRSEKYAVWEQQGEVLVRLSEEELTARMDAAGVTFDE